eukprot:GHVT01040585.1.p2 GENE.GHVT01040585.1~~GHVT01040585.1.p2  ORF type:complete len:107 (-),score=2.95 GHVT01040585.1:144-464(-)
MSAGCHLLVSQDGKPGAINKGSLIANFGEGLRKFDARSFGPTTADYGEGWDVTQQFKARDFSERYPKFPLYAYQHTDPSEAKTELSKSLPAYGTQITAHLNSEVGK